MLLDAIERNPRRNNTIVVAWSDHGYHVGDKNREGKTTLWEAANHANLLVIDPRNMAISGGARSTAAVSLQDLCPTVAALAGLPRPDHVHGYDLAPVLADPNMDLAVPVLSTHGEGNHSLRNGRYRYLRYANGDQELYDLERDPFETANLAADGSQGGLIDEHDRLLDEVLGKAAGDY